MALDFSTYPPKGHQERIAGYLRFEKLFLGQHKELYQATPGRYQMVRYIVANFAGLISRLAADLPEEEFIGQELVSDPPKVDSCPRIKGE